MYKCEYERIQSWWKPKADKLVQNFSDTYHAMIAEGPAAQLAKWCASSKTMDREFLNRLAKGDHLKDIEHPLCKDENCKDCHGG